MLRVLKSTCSMPSSCTVDAPQLGLFVSFFDFCDSRMKIFSLQTLVYRFDYLDDHDRNHSDHLEIGRSDRRMKRDIIAVMLSRSVNVKFKAVNRG